MILDRGPQFAMGLMRELNKMLGIETKLSIAYHPETDGQMERTNQELEQYLRIYINKSSLFQVNCEREPRIGFDIRKKEKNDKAKEFAKEMKKRHEEARAALVRSQEEIKRQTDGSRKEKSIE